MTLPATLPRRHATFSAWAVAQATRLPRAVSRGERAVLVLAAAHADAVLARDGIYTATPVDAAAAVLGFAPSTVEGFVGKLVRRGLLAWSDSVSGVRTFCIPGRPADLAASIGA